MPSVRPSAGALDRLVGVAAFWSKPLAGSIMPLALVMLVWPPIGAALEKVRQGPPVVVPPGEPRRMPKTLKEPGETPCTLQT